MFSNGKSNVDFGMIITVAGLYEIEWFVIAHIIDFSQSNSANVPIAERHFTTTWSSIYLEIVSEMPIPSKNSKFNRDTKCTRTSKREKKKTLSPIFCHLVLTFQIYFIFFIYEYLLKLFFLFGCSTVKFYIQNVTTRAVPAFPVFVVSSSLYSHRWRAVS